MAVSQGGGGNYQDKSIKHNIIFFKTEIGFCEKCYWKICS